MIKRIFQFGGLEGVSKLINWGTMMLLPCIVGAKLYGEIGLFISISGLCASLMLIGVNRSVLRFQNSESGFSGIVYCSLLIICILFAVVCAGAFLLRQVVKWPTAITQVSWAMIMVILGFGLFKNTTLIGIAYSRATNAPLLYGLFRFLPQVTLSLLIIVGYLLCSSIWLFAIGSVLTFFVYALITIYVFYKKGLVSRNDQTWRGIRRIGIFCWPFLFHYISGMLLAQIDRVFIAKSCSMQELGMYTFYYTLGGAVTFIFSVLIIAIEPMVYRQRSVEAANRYIHILGAMQIALGVIFAMFFVGFGSWGVAKLYSPEYLQRLNITYIILAGHLLNPIYLMGNMGLMYIKKTHYVAVGTFFAAVCNVVLNYIYVPRYGIYAAAVTTLLSYWVMAALVYGAYLLAVFRCCSLRRYACEFTFVAVVLSAAALEKRIEVCLLLYLVAAFIVLWRSFALFREIKGFQ